MLFVFRKHGQHFFKLIYIQKNVSVFAPSKLLQRSFHLWQLTTTDILIIANPKLLHLCVVAFLDVGVQHVPDFTEILGFSGKWKYGCERY